ncbi:hypothetical protein [Deinococcus budaensis]|uniref:Uncharacterized protein n=1 Tax=Deinococcus budaensis TaxID=1665626 RepID=A0A7W8LPM8_9DEIO|nr:hypothetical protein [Deinococcus budaensis]MBB5233931.1 hypothetical protein [Deinococcus budaensis]
MKRKTLLTLGFTLSALALAAPQRYEMRSYMQIDGKVQPAFAWCDAPDRVIGVTQPQKLGPAPQPIQLRQVLKRPAPNTDAFDYVAEYNLGPSDAGAGQVYTAITFPLSGGRYFIRTSNVENVRDPAYRMTRVNEFRTPEGTFPCRYQPQAAFMGATSRETVIVWDNGKTATYATRNFDGTPGVYVTGGRKINVAGTGVIYDFPGGNGSTYRVITGSAPGTSAMLNTTTREALKGLTQSFLAYSISLPVKEQP